MSTQFHGAVWRKSSRSNGNGGNNCVEVAMLDGAAVAVRDSKNPDGPALRFTPMAWESFVTGTKNGRFDSAN